MNEAERAEITEAVRLAWLEHQLTGHKSDLFRYENAGRTYQRKLRPAELSPDAEFFWVPSSADYDELFRLRDEKRAASASRSARNRTERDQKRAAAKALETLPPHRGLGKGLFG